TSAAAARPRVSPQGRRRAGIATTSSSAAGLTRAAAAAATMRLTASRSSGGSLRSSLTARLTTGSMCGSVMRHPRQFAAQVIRRALHAHLEGGLLHARHALDLLVRKLFYVVQQKNLSVVFRYLGQRLTHRRAPLVVQ